MRTSEWRTVRLDEACDVILGQSPPGTTYNTEARGLPFFQGKAEFGDLYPKPVKWCSQPSKIAERDDVLISVRAPVGPTNLCPERACIGRGLAALRPHDGIAPRYVLYAVRSNVRLLAEQATGSTFDAISGNQLRAHKIPLAPSNEQQQIVAEIEKQFTRLDAGVASLKRVQAAIKRYRAGVLKAACEGRLVPTEAQLAAKENRSYETGEELLQRILKERRENWTGKGKYKEPVEPNTTNFPPLGKGWLIAGLEQLTNSNRPICYGILMPKENVAEGVLYVKVKDMKGDRIDVGSLHRTTAEIASKYTRASLQTGDLLLAIRGTYGRVAETPPELNGGNITQDTARLDVTRLVDHRYVATCLRNPDCQNYFKRVARGVAVKGVNISDVKTTPIPLPPLAEQTRIVAEVEGRLSVVEELEAIVAADLQRADRLRTAVLQRAFGQRPTPA